MIYAATDKYDGLGIRFYFHAQSQAEANDKIFRWNRYHSLTDSPGWGWHEAIEVASVPDLSCLHNEWVT